MSQCNEQKFNKNYKKKIVQKKSTINRVTISQILCVSVPELSCDTKCWLCPFQHVTTCITGMYTFFATIFSLILYYSSSLPIFFSFVFDCCCFEFFFCLAILFVVDVFFVVIFWRCIKNSHTIPNSYVLAKMWLSLSFNTWCKTLNNNVYSLHSVFWKLQLLHESNQYFKFRILACLCVLLCFFFIGFSMVVLPIALECAQINTHFLWFYLVNKKNMYTYISACQMYSVVVL